MAVAARADAGDAAAAAELIDQLKAEERLEIARANAEIEGLKAPTHSVLRATGPQGGGKLVIHA